MGKRNTKQNSKSETKDKICQLSNYGIVCFMKKKTTSVDKMQ